MSPSDRDRLYFAYGANMDVRGMVQRAPASRLSGRACLDGRRFAIGRAGFATLLPSAWERVHGVLWQLSPADERALDEFEGVDEGLYRKEVVHVMSSTGESVDALTYVALDGRMGCPERDYIQLILDAARGHRLPEVYVAHLRTWVTRASQENHAP